MVPPILYKNIGSYVSWTQVFDQIKQAGTTMALIAGKYSAKEGEKKNVVKADEDKPKTDKVKLENGSTVPKGKPTKKIDPEKTPPLY